MSQDTKTIITVLLLIFFYPVGVILMWVWMKWPIWLKILLTLGIMISIIIILAVIGSSAFFIMNAPSTKPI